MGQLVRGTAGNDTLFGGGSDQLLGDDTIQSLDGNDLLLARPIDRSFGLVAFEVYEGGNGDDTFLAANGQLNTVDLFRGGAGNDVFEAAPAQSPSGLQTRVVIDGGDGTDTVVVQLDAGAASANQQLIDLATGQIAGGNLAGTILFGATPGISSVEQVLVTLPAAFRDDPEAASRIAPNAGDRGLRINVQGDAGGSLILSEAQLYANAGAGNDTVEGGSSGDVIAGDDGNDLLLGRGGNDFLYGGAGDDAVNGGAGSDVLEGGSGNDNLVGGTGADLFAYDLRGAPHALGVDGLFGFNRAEGDRIVVYGATAFLGPAGPPIARTATDSFLYLGRDDAGRDNWVIVVGVADLGPADVVLA